MAAPLPVLAPLALMAALAVAACGTVPTAHAEAEETMPAPAPVMATTPLYTEGSPWTGPEGAALRHAQLLTGRVPRFGGWSGLAIDRDAGGSSLVAVSDRGYWLRATYDEADGRLGTARMGRLHGPDGAPLLDNQQRDAESLVLLDSGAAIVAFERDHRLWLYPPPVVHGGIPFTGKPTPLPRPPDLDSVPQNGGMEAIALLPDGRLAVLIEGADGASRARGWLGSPRRPFGDAATDGEPPEISWRPFTLALSDGFRPTGAAVIKDRLLVLERAFSIPLGFRNRLRSIPLAALDAPAADQPVPARTLVDLDRPPVAENFEGLAAFPHPQPGPDAPSPVVLISDDNYNGLQRTLLVRLDLPTP